MARPVSLLVALFLTMPAMAQSHRALITEIEGTVTIVRADGSRTAASWGSQLFDGDLVQTAAGASVSLLFENGHFQTVEADSEADVNSESGTPAVDPTLLADVSELTLQRTGVGEIAALGGLRSGDESSVLDLTYPRHTRVMRERPLFVWTAGNGFESYTVRVLSDVGLVWSGTTTETQMAYPDHAPALEAGVTYYWRVEGEEMLDVTKSELVPFELVGADEVQRIAQAESLIRETFPVGAGQHYMLGSFYAKQGLHAEAITVFSEVAGTHENSAVLYEILGKLYYETGRKDLAVQSLQRALDLSRGNK